MSCVEFVADIMMIEYEPGRGRRPAVFRPMLNWFSSDACLDTALNEDDDKVTSVFFMIR